jgi:hypothetical protein
MPDNVIKVLPVGETKITCNQYKYGCSLRGDKHVCQAREATLFPGRRECISPAMALRDSNKVTHQNLLEDMAELGIKPERW